MKKVFILGAVCLLGACASLKTSGEYIFRGESYLKDGKPTEAIANYNKAIKVNPNNVEAYASRGAANYFAGNLDAAIEDFVLVINNQPYRSEAYSALGAALAAKGDYEDSLKYINASLFLNPNNVEGFFSRGAVNYALGHYDQAVNDYSVVIQNRPFADAYKARAAAYEKLGKTKEAKADAEAAATPGMAQKVNAMYGN